MPGLNRDPVGHPRHAAGSRHDHHLHRVNGPFSGAGVPRVVGVQVQHREFEFGWTLSRKMRVGCGALFYGRLKAVSARRTQRRMVVGPNTALGALDFHAAKIR